MDTIKNTELFEQYLDGEMNEEESASFLARLEEDMLLKEDYTLHKTIREVLSDKDMMDMHKLLNEIKSDFHKKRKRRKMLVGIFSSVASVILIFFVLQYLLFSQKMTNNEIYEKYYSKAEYDNTTRGAEPELINAFDNYLNLFNSGNLNDALNGFNSITENSEMYLPAKYFAAQCNMQLMNYKEAVKDFSLIIQNKKSIFYHDALWYSGLCHIKLNDNAQAAQCFNILASEKNCYRERAMEIISEL